jgi:F0F1-type ATP synthase delta subunit
MVPTAHQLTEAITRLSNVYGEQKAVTALVTLMSRSHLTHLLPAVVQVLKAKSVQEDKQSAILITSATPLSENVVDRISDLAHKDVGTIPSSVSMMVDKSLVGGFIAVYKGKVFDGSVATLLNSLLSKK